MAGVDVSAVDGPDRRKTRETVVGSVKKVSVRYAHASHSSFQPRLYIPFFSGQNVNSNMKLLERMAAW